MKRWLWLLAGLTITVAMLAVQTTRGQVGGARPPVDGPGAGGATLKLPGMEPAPTTKPAIPDSLKSMWNPAATAFPNSKGGASKVALPPSQREDINKDIRVTPEAGNWLIFTMAYTGPKAPEMARKFVAVMRGHYKWNAYVFDYGAEEKRKEYERVEKLRQEQIEALTKAGLKADVPVRIPAMRIDEQTGVLVGGFKTRDEAMDALKKLRALDPKGLVDNQVDLDIKHVVELDGKARKEAALVNPFLKAFPSRNPTLPGDRYSTTPDEDLKFLRHINAGEPFSLLQCKKPYTLCIKQFNVQFQTLDKDSGDKARGFIDRFNKGLGLKGGEWQDGCAHNAHNLAEGLRKQGIADTYVLHVKYCSLVTVGNYDRPDDPRLVAMQNHLERRFKMPDFANNRDLDMFPRPVVMQIPGVAAPKLQ